MFQIISRIRETRVVSGSLLTVSITPRATQALSPMPLNIRLNRTFNLVGLQGMGVTGTLWFPLRVNARRSSSGKQKADFLWPSSNIKRRPGGPSLSDSGLVRQTRLGTNADVEDVEDGLDDQIKRQKTGKYSEEEPVISNIHGVQTSDPEQRSKLVSLPRPRPEQPTSQPPACDSGASLAPILPKRCEWCVHPAE